MKASYKDGTTPSSRALQHIYDVLKDYDYQFKEVPEYDTTAIDLRSQVRSEKFIAPKDRVNTFADALRDGEILPPIVMTLDRVIIDGNTRIAAGRKRKRNKLPALVLDIKWGSATLRQKADLVAIGCRLNNDGPQPLDRAGKKKSALMLLRDGNYTAERVARFVGLDSSTVNGYVQEINAEKKLEKVGLDLNGSVAGVLKRAFGKASDLHDQPFAELVKLAVDAAMNAPEIAELAKRLRKAGSDLEAVAIVKAERKAREAAIRELKRSGRTRPPPSRKLKQGLGQIVKFQDANPDDLVEMNQELVEEYLDMLNTAQTILKDVVAAQERWLETADEEDKEEEFA